MAIHPNIRKILYFFVLFLIANDARASDIHIVATCRNQIGEIITIKYDQEGDNRTIILDDPMFLRIRVTQGARLILRNIENQYPRSEQFVGVRSPKIFGSLSSSRNLSATQIQYDYQVRMGSLNVRTDDGQIPTFIYHNCEHIIN